MGIYYIVLARHVVMCSTFRSEAMYTLKQLHLLWKKEKNLTNYQVSLKSLFFSRPQKTVYFFSSPSLGSGNFLPSF